MNLENSYRESLEELGYDLNEIYKLDEQNRSHHVKNANSSMSRIAKNKQELAESLVDSLATLDMPAWGYGLRFMYGNLNEYTKALKKHHYN